MKPEKHRTRSIRVGIARARMFMKADLGWLSGYPVALGEDFVHWFVVPPPGGRGLRAILLDREIIRRATETSNKLALHFPRALPRIVDDVERWKSGVPQLLEWLKSVIHDGRTPPESLLQLKDSFPPGPMNRARALVDRHPALYHLLEALAWMHFLSPRRFDTALEFVETYATQLVTLLANSSSWKEVVEPGPKDRSNIFGDPGIAAALVMESLAAADGASRLKLAMQFLGDERACDIGIDGIHARLEDWRYALTHYRKPKR